MTNRKITHKSARQKGSNFEREIAKKLKNIGIDAKRVPMSGALSWLKGDVCEFNTIYPHIHECKFHEALSINTWWDQAADEAKNGEVPVLHFTSSYKPVYSMLTSEDFDEMVFAYEKLHKEINLQVHELPNRKNFWKVIERQTVRHAVYITDDRVIMPLDTYLLLRKADIKYRSTLL